MDQLEDEQNDKFEDLSKEFSKVVHTSKIFYL
jgi:hypothetical protein